MIRRALSGIFLLAGVCAWANPPAATPTPQPKQIQLQDPMPGQALLYLVRISGDMETVTVLVDGVKVATMPPGSYTAIGVAPGARRLTAATPAGQERVTEISVQMNGGSSICSRLFHGRRETLASFLVCSALLFRRPLTAPPLPTGIACGQNPWSQKRKA